MERDCENCVYHTSNGCSKWNCQFETLAEHDKQIRAEVIDEIIQIALGRYHQKISAYELEQLKEQK